MSMTMVGDITGDTITWSGETSSFTLGSDASGTYIGSNNCWGWDYYYPYIHYFHPHACTDRDTFEKAFGIVEMLMKEGYLSKMKVEAFTKIVRKIAKTLA